MLVQVGYNKKENHYVWFWLYLLNKYISIGNRMNASAFRDLWARVMF